MAMEKRTRHNNLYIITNECWEEKHYGIEDQNLDSSMEWGDHFVAIELINITTTNNTIYYKS
jgi:hypothetical protein